MSKNAEEYLCGDFVEYLKRLHIDFTKENDLYRADVVYMIAQKIFNDRFQWQNPTKQLKITQNPTGCQIIKFPSKKRA